MFYMIVSIYLYVAIEFWFYLNLNFIPKIEATYSITRITLVNAQIFATDIISILGYFRCIDFENDIHFC